MIEYNVCIRGIDPVVVVVVVVVDKEESAINITASLATPP
jgi:hypothetical protein